MSPENIAQHPEQAVEPPPCRLLSPPLSPGLLADPPVTHLPQLRMHWFAQPIGYRRSLRAMQHYSRQRAANGNDGKGADGTDRTGGTDAIWLLQHPSTFTLGVSAPTSQVIDSGNSPVIRCDRGGQVTWHGPGQIVGYLLLDLRRRNLGVRTLVRRTEQMLRQLLADHGIPSATRPGQPGIYVEDGKIASLGFRIHRHFSYHGFSLNVNCDLEPFRRIHPCGVVGMPVSRLSHYLPDITPTKLRRHLQTLLVRYFAADAHESAH